MRLRVSFKGGGGGEETFSWGYFTPSTLPIAFNTVHLDVPVAQPFIEGDFHPSVNYVALWFRRGDRCAMVNNFPFKGGWLTLTEEEEEEVGRTDSSRDSSRDSSLRDSSRDSSPLAPTRNPPITASTWMGSNENVQTFLGWGNHAASVVGYFPETVQKLWGLILAAAGPPSDTLEALRGAERRLDHYHTTEGRRRELAEGSYLAELYRLRLIGCRSVGSALTDQGEFIFFRASSVGGGDDGVTEGPPPAVHSGANVLGHISVEVGDSSVTVTVAAPTEDEGVWLTLRSKWPVATLHLANLMLNGPGPYINLISRLTLTSTFRGLRFSDGEFVTTVGEICREPYFRKRSTFLRRLT